MSQTNVIYPQSTGRNTSWQVREDGDDYGKESNSNVRTTSLSDMHNRIHERLDRAKALIHLLKSADTQADDTIRLTADVVEDLIEKAQGTSLKMWEFIQREKRLGS
jgi:hypothetical protein